MAYTDPETIMDFSADEVSDPAWGQAMNDGVAEILGALQQPWRYWDINYSRLGNTQGVAKKQGYSQRIGHEIYATAAFEVLDETLLDGSSGSHVMNLPAKPDGAHFQLVGSGALYDSSAGVWHQVQILYYGSGAALARLIHDGPTGNGGVVNLTTPFTLATGDRGVFNLHYRVDSLSGPGQLLW